MTDQPAAASAGRNRTIAILLSIFLIGTFLWNLFTPAHEYPSRTVQVMNMGLDAIMIAALVGLRTSVPKPLFILALVAGIGLFGIRFTSDAAWWTGHYSYYLRPR